MRTPLSSSAWKHPARDIQLDTLFRRSRLFKSTYTWRQRGTSVLRLATNLVIHLSQMQQLCCILGHAPSYQCYLRGQTIPSRKLTIRAHTERVMRSSVQDHNHRNLVAQVECPRIYYCAMWTHVHWRQAKYVKKANITSPNLRAAFLSLFYCGISNSSLISAVNKQSAWMNSYMGCY